jgi:hypothetical protein
MDNILYFDINSGISGDMTIAALLDLGLDQAKFLAELDKLQLSGYKIEIKKVQKNGITASDFKVILANPRHPDQLEHHEHEHHEHEHHEHEHHEHEHHEHEHRNFNDIKELIMASELSQQVKELSLEIFSYVAAAEAKVHNKSIAEVHFHEVGAVDSIIDIVGTAILIEMLEPDHIYASPISLGTGFIKAAHGIIPVPAPATIEILQKVPVYSTGVHGELVTPTGAAIIKTLAEKFIDLPELEIEKIAYGAGKRDYEITNLLRVYQAKKKLMSNY